MAQRLNRRLIRFFDSPIWPALLSAFVAPGLGQISNRDYAKGILLLFTSIAPLITFYNILEQRLSLILPGSPDLWAKNPQALREALTKLITESPGLFITFYALVCTVWVFGVIDAYISGKQKRIRKSLKNEQNL